MVLAGACTVSTWVKTGEGNVSALWALLFTFIGMFLFHLHGRPTIGHRPSRHDDRTKLGSTPELSC